MKSAAIILVLLGCDCAETSCEYIRTVSGDWNTAAACEAALDTGKAGAETAAYPVVIGRCIAGDGQVPAAPSAAGAGLVAQAGGEAPAAAALISGRSMSALLRHFPASDPMASARQNTAHSYAGRLMSYLLD